MIKHNSKNHFRKRIIDENKPSCANKKINCLVYNDAFIPEEPKEKYIYAILILRW